MIKEIRNQLITDIQQELGSLSKVDRYRGEFEEDSNWDPTDRACFVQVLSWRPISKNPQNETLRAVIIMRIYAGGKLSPIGEGLDVVERIITLLNGETLNLNIDGEEYYYQMYIPQEGMDLILYEKGFEGYAFNLYLK